MIALVSAGLAVFGANVSLLVPQSLIGGLHQPRIAGASIETLRREVGELRGETVRIKRENELLLSRFALQEKSGSDITRRVGALESTMPLIIEGQPGGLVDRSNVTASILPDETVSFDVDGGTISIRQSTLPQAMQAQPLPAPIAPQTTALAMPDQAAYGIALGAAVPFEQAHGLWAELSLKLGPLLFGLAPLLADEANGDDKRIIVGPIAELTEARSLCQRFERVSIACMPMPYDGTPLDVNP